MTFTSKIRCQSAFGVSSPPSVRMPALEQKQQVDPAVKTDRVLDESRDLGFDGDVDAERGAADFAGDSLRARSVDVRDDDRGRAGLCESGCQRAADAARAAGDHDDLSPTSILQSIKTQRGRGAAKERICRFASGLGRCEPAASNRHQGGGRAWYTASRCLGRPGLQAWSNRNGERGTRASRRS